MNTFDLRNYGSWIFDMSRAPKGRVVTKSVTTNDGVKTFEAFEPDHVILASKCGKVTRSYWIPDEQRWCMFSKNEEPKAWQHWPEWPEDAIATLHAESSEFERLCGKENSNV